MHGVVRSDVCAPGQSSASLVPRVAAVRAQGCAVVLVRCLAVAGRPWSKRPVGHPMFSPVHIARASEAIVAQIEERIFEGDLGPGDRLPPERELARQFTVSRITIRDALRSLESRGFIDVRVGAGGGAFIRHPNIESAGASLYDMLRRHRITLDELIEARNWVEPAIADIAARKATPADIEMLRSAITEAKQALGTKPFMPSSVAFHVALATASHNTVLAATVYALRATYYEALARLSQPVTEIPQVAIREHLEILDAIKAQDSARARQLMYDHMRYFEQHLRAEIGDAVDLPAFGESLLGAGRDAEGAGAVGNPGATDAGAPARNGATTAPRHAPEQDPASSHHG